MTQFNLNTIPFKNRCADISDWAIARNLIKGSNPAAQALKLLEELGEAAGAIARLPAAKLSGDAQRISDIRNTAMDGIGDTAVVLVIWLAQLGYSAPTFTPSLIYADNTGQRALRIMVELGKAAEYVEHFLMDADAPSMENMAYTASSNDKAYLHIMRTFYHLSIWAVQIGCTLDECMRITWYHIKDRRGKMVDGIFVKEGD